jgi:hypothetical protein
VSSGSSWPCYTDDAPIVAVTTIALALAAGPALVQNDPPGSQGFLARSDGYASCGEYLTSDRGDQANMEEWILGFISGLNAGSAGPRRFIGHGYDINAIPKLLLGTCFGYSDSSRSRAAEGLCGLWDDWSVVGEE